MKRKEKQEWLLNDVKNYQKLVVMKKITKEFIKISEQEAKEISERKL